MAESDAISTLLANLITQPEIFCSIAHEIGLGRFQTVANTVQIAPGDTFQDTIVNQYRGFVTLFTRLRVAPSSPIVRLQFQKDDVPELDLSSFGEYDHILPNIYTPMRNNTVITFTNLSVISTPTIFYYTERLVIRSQYWDDLRTKIQEAMQIALHVKQWASNAPEDL